MMAQTGYRPARSLAAVLHDAVALVRSLWTALTAAKPHPTVDEPIDWEDGEGA